jgi:hypothetical protein
MRTSRSATTFGCAARRITATSLRRSSRGSRRRPPPLAAAPLRAALFCPCWSFLTIWETGHGHGQGWGRGSVGKRVGCEQDGADCHTAALPAVSIQAQARPAAASALQHCTSSIAAVPQQYRCSTAAAPLRYLDGIQVVVID